MHFKASHAHASPLLYLVLKLPEITAFQEFCGVFADQCFLYKINNTIIGNHQRLNTIMTTLRCTVEALQSSCQR